MVDGHGHEEVTMTDAERNHPLVAAASLPELYPVLHAHRMTAGWHKKRPSLWKEPRSGYQPLHWRYELGRLALDQAGRWIGTELAERRNLLLFNPVDDNDYDTVRTLVVAYQMIKPGEYARTHQHTPNAMRLILDAGPGCYTVVDGIKLPMRTGDFLITPGGCWHSHYNEGDHNAYWIDVLDVPLVHRLEAMLFSELAQRLQPVQAEPAAHPFYFPPPRTNAALDATPPAGGVKRALLETKPHIASLDIAMIRLAPGSRYAVGRRTVNRVLAVISGSGRARVGDLVVSWSRGDVLAVPIWNPLEIEASDNAQLLEVTDEPVTRLLGFYREAPAAADGVTG